MEAPLMELDRVGSEVKKELSPRKIFERLGPHEFSARSQWRHVLRNQTIN